MDVGHSCCEANDEPSGHSAQRMIPTFNVRPIKFTTPDYKLDYSCMPNFKHFAGPYKDYKPPGNRTPAVGEKIWCDVPYLPSYLDPLLHEPKPGGQPDNLYFRGPFYKGVSETHAEFVNRGVLPPRQFHEYVRHYEEPGMRHDLSVTHADFAPPRPMLPRDKAPCLKEDAPKTWYEPEVKQPKNPHAREHELRPLVPQVIYVDEEPRREFNTEHNDNYVCYQRPRTDSKIRDPEPVTEEIFLENLRETHRDCPHPQMADDESTCDGRCKVRKQCPGATPRRTPWLLHPKNYSFQNGAMLVPCKCRYDAEKLDGRPCNFLEETK